MAKITKNKFIEACKGSGGIRTTIAKNIGVTNKAIYEYLAKNPELWAYIQEEEDKILDMAEGSLFSQVRERQPWATKYLLSTKGKKRGYVEKIEQETTHSGSLNINLELAKIINAARKGIPSN